MAGSGGGPCCHFHRAKEGLLLAVPKGPGFKGCAIQIRRALRCWQVIAVYMRQTLWRGFGQSGFNRSWLLLVSVPSSHVSSYCCLSAAPLPNQNPTLLQFLQNAVKHRLVNMKTGRPCPYYLAPWLMASPQNQSGKSDRFPASHNRLPLTHTGNLQRLHLCGWIALLLFLRLLWCWWGSK